MNTFLTDRIFHPAKYNYSLGGQIHINLLRGHRSQTINTLHIISVAGSCFYSANSVVPGDLFSSWVSTICQVNALQGAKHCFTATAPYSFLLNIVHTFFFFFGGGGGWGEGGAISFKKISPNPNLTSSR